MHSLRNPYVCDTTQTKSRTFSVHSHPRLLRALPKPEPPTPHPRRNHYSDPYDHRFTWPGLKLHIKWKVRAFPLLIMSTRLCSTSRLCFSQHYVHETHLCCCTQLGFLCYLVLTAGDRLACRHTATHPDVGGHGLLPVWGDYD